MSLLGSTTRAVASPDDRAAVADGGPSPTRDDGLPRVVILRGGHPDPVRELMLRVASGDRDAFTALELLVGNLVRVNIRRVLRDASRSDEVTQEFFADVPDEITDFDPDRDSAQGWLLTRAHRRATLGLHAEAVATR